MVGLGPTIHDFNAGNDAVRSLPAVMARLVRATYPGRVLMQVARTSRAMTCREMRLA